MNNIKKSGFTLIELLVVIAVIAALAALAIPVLAGSASKAKLASEIAAGKSLTAALQMYAADNNGDVLPGYVEPSKINQTVVDKDGNQIASEDEEAKRYPWRLAPYLGFNIKTAFLASGQDILRNNLTYTVSLIPSLGMNTVYLGGDQGNPRPSPFNPRFSSDFTKEGGVKKMIQVLRPAQMIAFVSAFTPPDPKITLERQPGHFRVRYPASNVDFRHAGDKALVVFLDGHTELLDREQLRNERLWKNLPDNNYAMQ